MKASIFETRKGKTEEKRVSIILPSELHELIEDIKNQLKAKSPDMRFNVNAICVDALKKATKKAQTELTQMK